MNELPNLPNVNSHDPERADALARYFELRDTLVSLKSVPEPNLAAIEAVIQELEQAQMTYKATYGLYGNNPNDDSPPLTQSSAKGRPEPPHPG